jgi:hypothetical protein
MKKANGREGCQRMQKRGEPWSNAEMPPVPVPVQSALHHEAANEPVKKMCRCSTRTGNAA